MAVSYLKCYGLVRDGAKARVPVVAVGTAAGPDQDFSLARDQLHVQGAWKGDTVPFENVRGSWPNSRSDRLRVARQQSFSSSFPSAAGDTSHVAKKRRRSAARFDNPS